MLVRAPHYTWYSENYASQRALSRGLKYRELVWPMPRYSLFEIKWTMSDFALFMLLLILNSNVFSPRFCHLISFHEYFHICRSNLSKDWSNSGRALYRWIFYCRVLILWFICMYYVWRNKRIVNKIFSKLLPCGNIIQIWPELKSNALLLISDYII